MLTINDQSKLMYWQGEQLPLTITEYKIIALLAASPGEYFSCRQIYDVMKGIPGFMAGDGLRGVHANVRSAIKRIRRKFFAVDPTFDAIVCYTAFGYGWKKGTVRGQRCCPTCGHTIVDNSMVTVPAKLLPTLSASVVIPEQETAQ